MTPGVSFETARAPEGMRLYAIGDVHGRADLLHRMHERIGAELERGRPADWRIVHLGDYVDRGPDSRGVIERLVAARAGDERNICLMGNHDRAFLDFIEDPGTWPQFASFDGEGTARSYGVDIDLSTSRAAEAMHRELIEIMPQSHVSFLRDLAYSVSYGDFFFCHAGIRPGVALDRQDPHDLIWIRGAFHAHQGLYPKLIVHGHTPVRRPEILANRVNIDTMAFASGVLTAFVAEGSEKRLISA